MSNFKNLKELYQALLDGRTICHQNGTTAKMMDDNYLFVTTKIGDASEMLLGNMHIESASNWSIHQEPEKWFKVTSFARDAERPHLEPCLFKSEQDFLDHVGMDKEDYHWIDLTEF